MFHPSHVDAVNAAFRPDAKALERALASSKPTRRSQRRVLDIDGHMVDGPHLRRALQLLDRRGSRPA